jgi:GNAT superfamily N-acetyltransferase
MASAPVDIRTGYQPGVIGWTAAIHGTYYHRHWDFDLFFEAKVASELAAFLERYSPESDGFWTARTDGDIRGAIAIDGEAPGTEWAHLRWFIVDEPCQCRGIGGLLLDTAMAFCLERGHRRVYLWTFEGLWRARRLYESRGFELVETHPGATWGTPVNEQRFEWRA